MGCHPRRNGAMRARLLARAGLAVLVASRLACASHHPRFDPAEQQAIDSDDPHGPYPGTSRPSEILANISFSARALALDHAWKHRGSDAWFPTEILNGKAIKASRLLEVERDAAEREGNYFIVDVETTRGRPLLVHVVVNKRSGWLMSWAEAQVRTWHWSSLDLEAVGAQLERRFGAVNARYYDPSSNFGYSLFDPMVVADMADGRVIVNHWLDVFKEVGFEPDPPNLTEAELASRRAVQAQEPVIFKGEGVVKFRRLGPLETDR
jgi:hypothetical protein